MIPATEAGRIRLSDEAAEHLAMEIGPRVLRVAFTTGCGGSGYRLSFEDAPIDGDVEIEAGGVRLAFDSMAWKKLEGAIITWSEEEGGYLVDHPDAVMSTWCGM